MSAGNLVNALPRLGFSWTQHTSPRLLRSDGRDAAVFRGVLAVAGWDATTPLPRRVFLGVLEEAWEALSWCFRDSFYGIRENEDFVSWLFRVRRGGVVRLAEEIHENTWIEFVYLVVEARCRYLGEVPTTVQAGMGEEISGFARAVSDFWHIARDEWARDGAQLLMFAEPDLFGEALDWEGGEEEWGREEEDEEMKEVTAELDNLAVEDRPAAAANPAAATTTEEDDSVPMDLD